MARLNWIIVFCGCLTVAAADERRFREEAPRQWQRYLTFADQLQGKIIVKGVNTDAASVSQQMKHNADCGLICSPTNVFAFNSHYSFRLARKSPNESWVVTGIKRREEGNPDVFETKEALVATRRSLLFLSDSTFLPELLNQTSFHVKKVEQRGELVRVEFDNAQSIGVRSGTLILDPARFWCLRGGDYHSIAVNGEKKVSFELELVGDPPIPLRRVANHELTYADNGDKSSWIATAEFDLQVPAALPPDSEFTLTTFGLSEPPWLRERPKPTRWWLWIALAGGVILVLGVAVWWKRR